MASLSTRLHIKDALFTVKKTCLTLYYRAFYIRSPSIALGLKGSNGQMTHIIKEYQIMHATYRISSPFERNMLTGEKQHILSWNRRSCLLAGDPVLKRGSSQDMICCPVMFFLLIRRGTSCLVGGMFICFCIFPEEDKLV